MCICPIFWVAVMTFARVFRVVGIRVFCSKKKKKTGAPNENIVQNHLNIAWLSVF